MAATEVIHFRFCTQAPHGVRSHFYRELLSLFDHSPPGSAASSLFRLFEPFSLFLFDSQRR